MSKRSKNLNISTSYISRKRDSSINSTSTMNSKMKILKNFETKEARITLKMAESYIKSMDKNLKNFKPRAQPYKLKMIKDSLEKDSKNIQRCLKKFSSYFKQREKKLSKVVNGLMQLLEESSKGDKKILDKAHNLIKKYRKVEFNDNTSQKNIEGELSVANSTQITPRGVLKNELKENILKVNLKKLQKKNYEEEDKDSGVDKIQDDDKQKNNGDVVVKEAQILLKKFKNKKNDLKKKKKRKAKKGKSKNEHKRKFMKKATRKYSKKDTVISSKNLGNISQASEKVIPVSGKFKNRSRKQSENYEILINHPNEEFFQNLDRSQESSFMTPTNMLGPNRINLKDHFQNFYSSKEKFKPGFQGKKIPQTDPVLLVDDNNTPLKHNQGFSASNRKNIYNSDHHEYTSLSPDFKNPVKDIPLSVPDDEENKFRVMLTKDHNEGNFALKNNNSAKNDRNYLFKNFEKKKKIANSSRNSLFAKKLNFSKKKKKNNSRVNIAKYQGYKLINKFKNTVKASPHIKQSNLAISFGFNSRIFKNHEKDSIQHDDHNLSDINNMISSFKSNNSGDFILNQTSDNFQNFKKNQEWNRRSAALLRKRDSSFQNSLLGSVENYRNSTSKSKLTNLHRNTFHSCGSNPSLKFGSNLREKIINSKQGLTGASSLGNSSKKLNPVCQIVKGLEDETNLKKFKKVEILQKKNFDQDEQNFIHEEENGKKLGIQISRDNFDLDSVYNPDFGKNFLNLDI